MTVGSRDFTYRAVGEVGNREGYQQAWFGAQAGGSYWSVRNVSSSQDLLRQSGWPAHPNEQVLSNESYRISLSSRKSTSVFVKYT